LPRERRAFLLEPFRWAAEPLMRMALTVMNRSTFVSDIHGIGWFLSDMKLAKNKTPPAGASLPFLFAGHEAL
jgi:hypothetical protein